VVSFTGNSTDVKAAGCPPIELTGRVVIPAVADL